MKKICLLLYIVCICSCKNEKKNEKLDKEFKEQFSEQEKHNKEAKEFEKKKKIERERFLEKLNEDELNSLLAEDKITASEYAKQLVSRQNSYSLESESITVGRQIISHREENLGTDTWNPK